MQQSHHKMSVSFYINWYVFKKPMIFVLGVLFVCLVFISLSIIVFRVAKDKIFFNDRSMAFCMCVYKINKYLYISLTQFLYPVISWSVSGLILYVSYSLFIYSKHRSLFFYTLISFHLCKFPRDGWLGHMAGPFCVKTRHSIKLKWNPSDRKCIFKLYCQR